MPRFPRLHFLLLFLPTTVGLIVGPRYGNSAISAPPPYTLSELYRSTVGGAEDVRSRIEERTQLEEIKSQSRDAFLPTISGVGTYFQTADPTRIGAGYNGNTQKTAKVVAREFLFRGGSEFAFLSRTERLLEGKDAEIAGSRLRYFVDLAAAYYDTLLRRSLRTHADTELHLYDTQIGELRSRVRIGRTRTSDLTSVEAARAGSEARLRSADSDFLQSKLRLADLARIGLEYDLREEDPVAAPLAPLDDYLKASAGRPDLVAARKRRDAAEEDIAYQRGFHFPTLDLAGNYYLKREGYPNDSKWDAVLTLTVPLFTGGIIQSQVRQAASVYRQSEISTGRLERGAEIEIRSLHQTLVAAAAELKSFSEAVVLATKAYEQTQRDYKFGLATNLDLLNSLQTLTNAKRSYDQARYQRILERIRLEAGTGRLPIANTST